jgi:cation:H+ antiporter
VVGAGGRGAANDAADAVVGPGPVLTGAAAALGGFVLLVLASGRFVDGAVAVALRFRVPAIVVGAVIVGFGTSAPELLACALAAAEGSRDIAVGTIVGSNMANLTLVLGVVAVLTAPAVARLLLRRDLPVMLGAMAVFAIALVRFSRSSGVMLLGVFAVAMAVMLRAAREPHDGPSDHRPELGDHPPRSLRVLALETAGGLLGTVAGAQLLVAGARGVADDAGVSEGLVGFTLVALGTSLPEVVAAVQAGRRGEPDLAIGNVVGSNLFNSLAIAGTTALVSPGPVDGALVAAAWAGVVVAAAAVALMATSRRLVRWEGGLLIAAYLATLPMVA